MMEPQGPRIELSDESLDEEEPEIVFAEEDEEGVPGETEFDPPKQ